MRTFFPKDIEAKLQKVATFVPRFGISTISDFIAKNDKQMICGLIGLRNTGKTTMLLQAMADLSDDQKEQSVFLEMEKGDLINDLKAQIESLAEKGCSIFFINEITKLEDFTRKSAILANYYAMCGHKIIATGDDSLSLVLSSRSSLFDRIKKIRTTRMTWEEYALVNRLNSEVNDNYLENGGIMPDSNSQKIDVEKYVREAIVDNLVYSLDHYKNGQDYDVLIGLRNNGGLGDLVFSVLEDNGRKFILSALEHNDDFGDFKNFLGEEKNFGMAEERGAVVEWLIDMDVLHRNPDSFGKFKDLPKILVVQPALRWHFVMKVLDKMKKAFGKDDKLSHKAVKKIVKDHMVREISAFKD